MARAAKRSGERASTTAPTIAELRELLRTTDKTQFAVIERSLAADSRTGVQSALASARRRIEAAHAEQQRLQCLYEHENHLAIKQGGAVILGLDEVGRGSLAGPVAAGAVVLPREPYVEGLNDSKQISPPHRARIASAIKHVAHAWAVAYVEPADIDAQGMSAALRLAFCSAIGMVEATGLVVDVVLIDGNPIYCDPREVCVVKGDASCASIAAASIVAKVERDALMERLDKEYPEYGFASNKGYASKIHIEAIRQHGLSPIHRASFCGNFMQQSLF